MTPVIGSIAMPSGFTGKSNCNDTPSGLLTVTSYS